MNPLGEVKKVGAEDCFTLSYKSLADISDSHSQLCACTNFTEKEGKK